MLKLIKSENGWEWTKDTLKVIIGRIQKRSEEAEEEGNSEFDQGRQLAFYEVLDMIKNDLESRGYTFEDFMKDEDEAL